MNTIKINGSGLTIEQVYLIADNKHHDFKVELAGEARERIYASRAYVDSIVEKENAVYGINTGFGALSNKFIQKSELSELQYNLQISPNTETVKKHTKLPARYK